jgi:transposase
MKRTRRKFNTSFKTKVALEAIKERMTTQELASKFDIHSSQITSWKKEFLENASSVFETGEKDDKDDLDKEKLYSKIGQLQVENDFLKHVLGK